MIFGEKLEKTTTTIKQLKIGGFVLIDDAPCKVEKVEISKSGKHGAAKARLEAMGILDNKRRSIVKPAHEEIFIPILLKKKAQLLAIVGDKAQLMDMETYETFELDIPEEMKGQLVAGSEINYFEVADVRTLKQLK